MLFCLVLFLLADITIGGNTIPNCQSINIVEINGVSKVECKQCNEGYAIDDNKLCNKCNTSAGYIEDTTQLDFTCKEVICTEGEDYCSKCSTETSCSQCNEGYELNGPQKYQNCLKCALGYEQSSSQTKFECVRITCTAGERHCTKCLDNYQCSECEKGYKSSSQQYIDCDSCMEGYNRITNGNDFQCTPNCPDTNCARCDEPNKCAQCKDDYFLDIRGSCLIKCEGKIDNCIRCITTLQNEIQCESCHSGYDITKDYKCGKIPYKCSHGVPETQICTDCEKGFYLKSDSCHPCPENQHCTSCSLKDGSSTEVVCDECDYYFYLSEGICIDCPDNCEECEKVDGTLQCTSCDSGYYLSDGACIKCAEHCTWCNYENKIETCTRCESGYSLNDDGVCSPCSEVPNCSNCNLKSSSDTDSNYCQKCITGFILSKESNTCISCNMKFCNSCNYVDDESSKLYCTECEDGYYTPSKEADCIPCPTEKNCSRCSKSISNPENVICLTCKEGFYESELFVCESCPENCLSCYPNKNDFICTKCDDFSELKDGKCQLKPCNTEGMSHCSKCRIDSNENKECLLCDSEYFEVAEDKLSCKPIHIYYVQIQNNIADPGYSLYAKNGNDYIEIAKGTPFKAIKEMEFSIDVYLTSTQCNDYTLINTIKSSLSETDFTSISNSEIPIKCINPSTYEVCLDLSSFTKDYAFGYILSYEENNEMHSTSNGKLDIAYNHHFKLYLYLTKSPNCIEGELVNEYDGSIAPQCLKLTLNNIPDHCKDQENVTTDISTPKPTDIPTPTPKVEKIDKIEITAETTDDALSSQLTDKFNNLNNENSDSNSNTIKIVQIESNSNTIMFNHILNDDQLIKVGAGKEIQYNGGKLNLALVEEGVDVLINNEQSNIKLYGSGKINLKLPEKDTDSENIILDIQGNSDINGSVIINVPNGVNSLSMDTVNFESGGSIEVNNENSPVTLTVNTVKAAANTETELSNMIIKKSFDVVQSAVLDLKQVEFDENAKIEYQIYNYGNLDYPVLRGNLAKPPKNIVLSKPVDSKERPQKDNQYILIAGTFENGNCDSWGKSIDYSDTGFNDYLCFKIDNDAKMLEGQDEALFVRSIDKPSNNNNKNIGMIIGIVVGCVVVVAVVVVVVIVIIKKKKNSNSSEAENNENQNADIF